MAGTKMLLRRFGNVSNYWLEQEIIIDQTFLDTNNGLFITSAHPYVLGIRMLDVYFNGQLLSVGGGYEEVDTQTIRLDLGKYPAGHPLADQPVPLVVGDEIYIRTWKQEYRHTGGGSFDELRFKALEEEIIGARKYKDSDIPHSRLDNRLDLMEQKAETKTIVFVMNRLSIGPERTEIRFPFDGEITEVYVSCSQAGTSKTVLQIERCTQADYDATPLWNSIVSQGVTLDPNEKSTNSSSAPYTLADPKVTKHDHFRLNVTELGAGIRGVTVELMIRI
ncbi:hypothetical protein [Paenibacillus arenosi]|uniref:Virion structural protein n=1 Tax=Paenibacillus arenosi TaxID=2774142 RepID=A0ABR9AXL5_9BACL|nr:hypothetical protein [Paenibacillus arenosi]MBD8498879.1 hypothetical protein [Paenibacillus arenosi]